MKTSLQRDLDKFFKSVKQADFNIRASQGETTAVTAHVPITKKAGATRDELKEAIIQTTTVCGIKGIASCLIPALEAYDNAE
ncbi:hypothetical protein AGMMS50239_23690 [Bacteroidia bacterium]|nr:hypothetical protein AGMMS50239_23690 [Bacteroidia bacterium]